MCTLLSCVSCSQNVSISSCMAWCLWLGLQYKVRAIKIAAFVQSFTDQAALADQASPTISLVKGKIHKNLLSSRTFFLSRAQISKRSIKKLEALANMLNGQWRRVRTQDHGYSPQVSPETKSLFEVIYSFKSSKQIKGRSFTGTLLASL